MNRRNFKGQKILGDLLIFRYIYLTLRDRVTTIHGNCLGYQSENFIVMFHFVVFLQKLCVKNFPRQYPDSISYIVGPKFRFLLLFLRHWKLHRNKFRHPAGSR